MSEPEQPTAPATDAAQDAAAAGANPADTKPVNAKSGDTKSAATKQAESVATKSKPVNAPSGRPRSRVLLYLLLLIMLGGLAALFYRDGQQQRTITSLHENYLQLQEQSAALTALDAQVAALQEARAGLEQNLQTALNADQNSQGEQARRFEALDRELAALRSRLASDTGQSADNLWRLAEAESLLRLAQQRLLLAGDVRPALGLSLAADELLRGMDDGAVFNVREALARDIAALQGVREVDVPGLYARLGGAIAQVDALAIQPEGEAPDFRVQAPAGTAADSWWSTALGSFEQYFVVRHGVETPVAQLGADQAWVVKEQVQLRLEEARVALLRGQQPLYVDALEAAGAGVEQWLQGEGKPALLNELQTLRDSPMRTEPPTADAGLQALRALREQLALQGQGATAP